MRTTAGIVAAAALVGAAGGTVGALSATATRSTTRTITTAAAASGSAVAERSSALTVARISKRDSTSVVEITSTLQSGGNGFGGESGSSAEGTGFVYDAQGDIVTNNHVVDGATAIHVKFPDGSTYTASVVGTDASTDLAIVHVDAPASELHPLTLADSSEVAVGDAVVAIGNPFGLDNTVTSGIVSAVDRKISSPSGAPITGAIQTDAAINHGNSGGPLLNIEGEVIGVTSQIESSSGGNEGVGFAIPSNTVRRVAGQILGTGT